MLAAGDRHGVEGADGDSTPWTAEVAVAASTRLTRVVAEHPSAVLVVDLDEHRVVYANDLARQLAPDLALPVGVEEWSRAAGLQDDRGEELDDTVTPLHRVASGEPVTGEAVTARRSSDATDARESLWVIGMPLADAPPPLDRRALVVFLPLRDHVGVSEARQAGLELQHRAVISSEVSFSISDPHAPDHPLVWVNPAFEATTGYRGADVVGTNCRFLQGPGTDPAAVERIREGLRVGGTVTETLLNYRADGTAFWNHLVISPIHDAHGRLTHYVGVQSDVTARVEIDAERAHALAVAEAANGRLAALAAVSARLSDNLDTGEATIDALPAAIVAHFPGWAIAAGLDEQHHLTRLAVAHSDADRDARATVVGEALRQWLADQGSDVVALVLARLAGRSPMTVSVDEVQLAAVTAAAGLAAHDDLVGHDGATFVLTPLTAKGTVTGLLVLARDGHDAYSTEDLAAVADLGVRAGVAVDNARLYAREHSAALTLQQSLLPTLPTLEGFEVAATYQPAHGQAQVGGDWFDVLDLPGSHGVGVAVGDVMGHDLRAAAAMGQLRSVLRSYAWQGDSPAHVIQRLDELVQGLGMAALATCAYAVVCVGDGGDCAVEYTLAGHPPPMIWHPDGRVERLDGALTSPIGISGGRRPIPQAVTQLPIGGYLVLYTDGLVERRHLDIDASLDRLEQTLLAAPSGCDAELLCAHLVTTLTGDDHDDDICVLVLRRTGP